MFFGKPGLSEFHESSAEKTIVWVWKIVSLQSQACLNFKRLVCKKQIESEK